MHWCRKLEHRTSSRIFRFTACFGRSKLVKEKLTAIFNETYTDFSVSLLAPSMDVSLLPSCCLVWVCISWVSLVQVCMHAWECLYSSGSRPFQSLYIWNHTQLNWNLKLASWFSSLYWLQLIHQNFDFNDIFTFTNFQIITLAEIKPQRNTFGRPLRKAQPSSVSKPHPPRMCAARTLNFATSSFGPEDMQLTRRCNVADQLSHLWANNGYRCVWKHAASSDQRQRIKIAPWSSRWFEEILISLTLILLTLILLTLILVTFLSKILTFFTQYSQLGNSFGTHANGTNSTKWNFYTLFHNNIHITPK